MAREGLLSGFTQAGGLELATSEAGSAEIERRVVAARAVGLEASLLTLSELPDSVASFVDIGQVTAAAHFLEDAVAVPSLLAKAIRDEASARGARFLPGNEVIGIERSGGGDHGITVTTTSADRFTAADVVLAGGAWGLSLAALTGLDLPLFPVAHPYVYSAADAELRSGSFVR